MIGCCSPHVAVSCTEDTMTVVVGDDICSITAGDQVSVTETDHSWIINVNGDLTEIPKVPEVNVEMTEECYRVSVGERSICIPRCRTYTDCDGQPLPDCARLVTCERLDELIDETVTCYNGDDFEITQEIRNGRVVNCLNLVDQESDFCNVPEVPSLLPVDRVVICRNGNTRIIDPSELFTLCLDIPQAGESCGVREQVVVRTNAQGCQVLERVSTTSFPTMLQGLSSVWNHYADNVTGMVVPDDFVNPTNFYELGAFVADGGSDSTPYNGGQYGNARRAAPGINNARVNNSRLARFTGTNNCATIYDVRFIGGRNGTYPDFAAADAARAYIAYRVRFRAAGSSGAFTPWLYNFAVGSGNLATASGPFTGVEAVTDSPHQVTLQVGDYELEYFYIAPATTPLKFNANTFVGNFGSPQPRFQMVPRV